ncbi:MAG: glycosyltransferase family 39 protein [Nitrososphaerales archaeon]
MCFLIVSYSLSIYRFLEIASSHSFGWDSAAFLQNGAIYAGYLQYQQGYDPTRPPVLPVVLSLMFRVTGPSVYSGYLLSGLLYFLAMTGAYLLARKIMNPWLAILPALTYGVAPMVIEWGGIVYSDVEGIAIASLGLAVFVSASKNVSGRYLFLLAIPLLMLAPLTRYALGIIFVPALIYLAASGNARSVLRSRSLYAGLGIGMVLLLLLSLDWIGYPLSHGYHLSSLTPTPQTLNPFSSPLAHYFFVHNFANSLGTGFYGDLLAVAFIASAVCSLVFLITGSLRRPGQSEEKKKKKKLVSADPLVYSLIAWFVILFVYYSWFWPYSDLRYSIEFIMPVIILAFWGIGRVLGSFYSFANRHSSQGMIAASILVLIVVVSVFTLLEVQSGAYVIENTPVVDTALNAGIRQAVAWVESNVPTNVHIQADWYTFLWWYMPQYYVTTAPASYQLVTSSDYRGWLNTISQNNVGYVIYSNPNAINVPQEFHPVFNASDGVVVFRVGNGTA